MKSHLLIFTSTFPYGSGETFFVAELAHLATRFEAVYILPQQGNGPRREVPPNVRVLNPLYSRLTFVSVLLGGLFSLCRPGRFYKVFGSNFISNVGQYFLARSAWARSDVRDLMNSCYLKYFYWGKGAANLNIFFDIPGEKVVRFHGYDLYEADLRPGNIVPLRRELIKFVQNFVFVSEHGRNYLHRRYGASGRVFSLGAQHNGDNPSGDGAKKVILTCSFLNPVKRVWLLAEALRFSKSKIIWFHIGDGEDKERVLNEARELPSNIEFRFLGNMTPGEIREFYLSQHVDLLVNVSESEGLPVSMMEAISYGVPILATDVGGVSEIVPSEVGWLLQVDEAAAQIAGRIDSILGSDLQSKREAAKRLFFASFDIDRNNEMFGDYLVMLSTKAK